MKANVMTVQGCRACGGTGWKPTENGGGRDPVERCECMRIEALAGLLRKVPLPYRDVRLEELRPSPNSFAPIGRQAKIIGGIQSQPRGSYFLLGPTGVGKTHLLWALYRWAIEHGANRVYPAHMPTLALEWHDWVMGNNDRRPVVMREDILRDVDMGRVPHVFLDEVDKAKASDFVRGRVHGLIDALTLCPRAQLVLASNMTREEFGEAWGGDVLRRIEAIATTVDLGIREQEAFGA